jgi:probable rRNA maturation factor
MDVSIKNLTRSPLPRIAFNEIKKAILGSSYELSLVFVGTTRSRALNKHYRTKDKPTNVLAFPLDVAIGEVFICPHVADKQAPDFSLSKKGMVAYLFIHACLHLKGLDHGARMEALEATYMKKFSIT